MSDQHSSEDGNEEMVDEEDFGGLKELNKRLQAAINDDDGEEEGRKGWSGEEEDNEDREFDGADFGAIIDDIENNSEDEGFEDYKKGGYHTVHVG